MLVRHLRRWPNIKAALGECLVFITITMLFNPLTAELFNLNFHPLEVVSRWRDPQLQVNENYPDLTKWR